MLTFKLWYPYMTIILLIRMNWSWRSQGLLRDLQDKLNDREIIVHIDNTNQTEVKFLHYLL